MSSHMPVAASNISDTILARMSARTGLVAPVWSGVKAIRDPYSNAGEGQVVLNLTMLYNVALFDAATFSIQGIKSA